MLIPLFSLLLAADAACRPASGDGMRHLGRAIEVIGLPSVGDRVRVTQLRQALQMRFQSERQYPPFAWLGADARTTTDWTTGALRVDRGTGAQASSLIATARGRATQSQRGTFRLPPLLSSTTDDRAMDPWTVLADWRDDRSVQLREECHYRDYWRIVLVRAAAGGEERLFVDAKSGFPVKLERREPHMLWGDVLVEYLWSTWTPVRGAPALAPRFAYRLRDGELEESRSYERSAILPRDSAGILAIPADAAPAPGSAAGAPDTVRVSATTYLLVSRSFTTVVTRQRDTVFVLDAPEDQRRAVADADWVARLFSARLPVVVIVSDVAWPHVAGVREWIARGAHLVSHRTSRPLLEEVIARRWTLAPDDLERRRDAVRPPFREVDAALTLAGGAVEVRAIDGIGSEGALLVYLPAERFLYAGDFIQPGGAGSFSSVYAREVAAATKRDGFAPERFAAMHLPLTSWRDLPTFTGVP